MNRSTMLASSVATLLLATGSAMSAQSTPTITMSAPATPTGIHYVANIATSPFRIPLTWTVTNVEGIGHVHEVNVTVTRVGPPDTFNVLVALNQPFHGNNANQTPSCKVDNAGVMALTSCVANSWTSVTIGKEWTINQYGVYKITSMACATGSDKLCSDGSEGDWDFREEFLIIEAPAPPAVANAYLKETAPKFKNHGCVIKQVAEVHAKYAGTTAGYGPKGGPYDTDKIHAHVEAFKLGCM